MIPVALKVWLQLKWPVFVRNFDESNCGQMVQEHGVSSIPTFICIFDDIEFKRWEGFFDATSEESAAQLQTLLNDTIEKTKSL